ncbi:MAG: helix-turn-helix transcriptional regulator [Oscillospiraceae bacterium]|jgi:transcriptional regulator with XRE-family HTH domain|nr:helix-turn-helix transcriptional regulator [Oscillospiraceae bacterium]
MEMKLSCNIAKKRHEKGITQKELAEYIGVSKAAVSKWEKGQSYPDIVLLPQLATFFNISVDELLGYSPQLTSDDIRKLCLKLSQEFTTKPIDVMLQKCKEITKEYSSCFPLLYHLAVMLINHAVYLEEENKKSLLQKARALSQRVVADCDDALLAKDALNLQCFCCILLGEPDEVFKLIGESLRSSEITEGNLISQAFELAGNNNKAIEISQCGLFDCLWHLIDSAVTYTTMTIDTFEISQISHSRLIQLIDIYNVEKLAPNMAARAYLLGVELYCKHGQIETAFDWLEKCTDLCLAMKFPIGINSDSFFTEVKKWLDDSVLGSIAPLDAAAIKQNMLHSVESLPSLIEYHNHPRYKAVIKRITDFINEKEKV